jgi:hypothetical protein
MITSKKSKLWRKETQTQTETETGTETEMLYLLQALRPVHQGQAQRLMPHLRKQPPLLDKQLPQAQRRVRQHLRKKPPLLRQLLRFHHCARLVFIARRQILTSQYHAPAVFIVQTEPARL